MDTTASGPVGFAQGDISGIDSRRMLAVLVDNLEGMVFRCSIDAEWTLLLASEGCRRLTGYAPAELIGGRSWETLTHPDDRNAVRSRIMAAVEQGVRYRVEYRIVCCDGTVRWVQEQGVAVRDELGRQVLEGYVEDISAHVVAVGRLADAEARFRGLFENLAVGVFQTTADGRYLAANTALARMYGYASADELIAGLRDIDNNLYVDPHRREAFKREIREKGCVSNFESQIYRRDGTTLWISETAHAIPGLDGESVCYQGTVEDISDRRFYQERLRHQANHDPLTGLPNRNLLRERFEQAVALANRDGGQVAVAFIDLDNFKVINDSLGHAIGDRLLVEVGRRISDCLRDIDTVIRYGGDEFVMILHRMSGPGALDGVLDRVHKAIAKPVLVDGRDLLVTCSVGVAVLQNGQDSIERLLQDADTAMYSAKAAGRSSIAFHTPILNSAMVERLNLETGLRLALGRGEIDVHFQPRVDKRGRLLSFEALARWHSAEFGSVSPAVFVPIAEEIGLIDPITDFVLQSACTQARAWEAAGMTKVGVAVNLSSRSFHPGSLVVRVHAALRMSGLPGARLELEITESALMSKASDVVAQLHALKALGVRLAVDDFGTGYSSLAYLCQFPLDTLKIDQSFVRHADQRATEAILVQAIISLGRQLGLTVVAEGVETQDQWHRFSERGCDEFQGYLFSAPMPASRLAGWFVQHQRAMHAGQATDKEVVPQ